MSPLPETALRAGYGSRLDLVAPAPRLFGRSRRHYRFHFPQLSLNAGDIDTRVIRIPGDAHFLVRQVLYSVTLTSNPIALGKARITTASARRASNPWMQELTPLELFASANFRTPHHLSRPVLLEPGTSATLEVQNTTSSTHAYDVTLVGELIFDMAPAEAEALMRYNWFGFYVNITPQALAQPTTFVEVRNQPDADFYITHLPSNRIGPTNSNVLGPTLLQLIPSSTGRPFSDTLIPTSLLCGLYYNLTSVPVTSVGPQPLPEPYLIEANGSVRIQCIQPANPAPTALDLLLEGVKVFK